MCPGSESPKAEQVDEERRRLKKRVSGDLIDFRILMPENLLGTSPGKPRSAWH